MDPLIDRFPFAVNRIKLERAIKAAGVGINGLPTAPTDERVKELYVLYGGLLLDEGVEELKQRARYNKFSEPAAIKLEEEQTKRVAGQEIKAKKAAK